jgi:aminoglycoside phosphotransferase (APT) family kinase protein
MSARENLDFQASFSGTQEVREPHRFDVGQLQKYLETALPSFRGPLEVREFKGGQSNPTYHLSTPDARYVLRRKPPGKLLRSAHAVDREFRVISALNRVDFPVPRAHLLCEDESVIGTVFYVMECVEGRVLWDSLMRDLCAYEALGLSDFGRPGNYFARQISRWTKQYVASETEEIPEMNRLIEWLPANLPEDETCTIIHGDYKLDNMVVHPTEPRVIAILDWELSTLGNPLGDLTYHLSHRHAPRSVFEDLSDADYATLGIPTDAEWVERYCELTGREAVRDLDFYLAYNIFRSAGILQGIVGRVRDGTAASAHAASMASGVRPLAVRAMDYARKLGA